MCRQVNVGFSHHTVDLGNDSIQCEKRLCFVMDPPKAEEPKNKKRKKDKKAKAGEPHSEKHYFNLTSSLQNLTFNAFGRQPKGFLLRLGVGNRIYKLFSIEC